MPTITSAPDELMAIGMLETPWYLTLAPMQDIAGRRVILQVVSHLSASKGFVVFGVREAWRGVYITHQRCTLPKATYAIVGR